MSWGVSYNLLESLVLEGSVQSTLFNTELEFCCLVVWVACMLEVAGARHLSMPEDIEWLMR
jgi:hypothetical protein